MCWGTSRAAVASSEGQKHLLGTQSPLDVVYLCLWKDTKDRGSSTLPPLHNPFTGRSRCPCSAPHVAEGGHVPATRLVISCMLAGLLPASGLAQQGWRERAPARRRRPGSQLVVLGPDRLFFSALFCINPRCRSTSSDVTNTHGFSLLFPLRKVGGD